ncbi:uncharacterized protein KGF55_000274 [Candida pseudojiufengensis]|uniref:uncharacterized protein n=1 Tax=Candida pseudojiufengensis TaxID=497109 RepID=UPI0022240A05|nr:uncharacterized protein KGF55_000274 [Candida pseudojiufengensis]KAI5966865.1 hypothetical protein KGF55_000274 [Candida pseudojiufengensis]
MTNIVIDPKNINKLFPNASLSQPIRIRIIAQIINFNQFTSDLIIVRVPSLTNDEKKEEDKIEVEVEDDTSSLDSIIIIEENEVEESKEQNLQQTRKKKEEYVSINLSSIQLKLNLSMLKPGNIINLEGFYNGINENDIEDIDIFNIFEIDCNLIKNPQYLNTLKYLSDLNQMKPISTLD